ncbi:MAG: ATP-binding protein [Muribaculaceae bacterium]|nr:ATP-binding protein [Muribaculaceae bacterium]
MLYIIATVCLSIALLTLFIAIYFYYMHRRLVRTQSTLSNTEEEMAMALNAGEVNAWCYDIENDKISTLHGEDTLLPYDGKTLEYVYSLIDSESRGDIVSSFNSIIRGNKLYGECTLTSAGVSGKKVLEVKMKRIEDNRIVGTLKNITSTIEYREKLERFRVQTLYAMKVNDISFLLYDVGEHLFTRIDNENCEEGEVLNREKFKHNVYKDDYPEYIECIKKMDQCSDENMLFEMRKRRGDKYVWYKIMVTPYHRDEKSKPLSYIIVEGNNTKWKEINNELISLRNKAEVSNRLKNAFLANMSHEIRTPLNAIVGFSNLIAEDNVDETTKNEYKDIINTSSDQLLRLINDILDLSKIEAGVFDFKYSTFDFAGFFKDLSLSLSLRAPQNVKLVCESPFKDFNLYGDKQRIAQVIINFVTNAFKFTSQGEVIMRYNYVGTWLSVEVEDTGTGISPENISRIFNRFEKLNDFAPGSGLGLSISKVLIEAMGGKIGVESVEGKGSTFKFTIPCNINFTASKAQEKSQALLDTISPKEIERLQKEHATTDKRKLVLIAEDIDNNYILAHHLLDKDYRIIRARDGIEAVSMARTYSPDVILMDMMMPHLDGLQATRQIREFDSTTPIIAVTAYVFDTDRDDAISAGCNDFVAKPLTNINLMATIDNLFDKETTND